MKIGTINWATYSGLGILTKEFWDNGIINDILIPIHPNYPDHSSIFYPGKTTISPPNSNYDVNILENYIKELDVLFLFETYFYPETIPIAKKYKIPINDYLKNNDYKHWFEKIERDYKELTDKEERLIKLNEKIENKIKELQKNNSKEGQQELKKIIDKQNDLIDLIEELKNNLNNSVKDVKELTLTFEETTDLRNELSKRNLNNLMKRGNIGKYETRPEGNELTKKLLLERFKDKLPEIKEMINDYKKREDINDYNIKELERITPQLTSKKMKTKKEENEKELEERKKEREYNKKHLKFLNVLYKRFEKLIEYTKENRFNSYKLGMYYDEKIGTYFKNFKEEFKKNDYDMRLSGFGKKLYK